MINKLKFSLFLIMILLLLTNVYSKEENAENNLCDSCSPHCELRKQFIAVVCDVLKTKEACERVNGCLWIE